MKKQTKTKARKEDDLLTSKSDDFLMRHQLFIEEYLQCFNATQAYQFAYPDASYDTASVNGYKLLRNTKIRSELERRFKELVPSKNEILARLNDQINATLLPFVKVDDDGHIYFNFKDKEAKKHFHLIKKVKHRKLETFNERDGEAKTEHWVEVDLHDPQKALELLGKYYALFTDKVQSTDKKVIKITYKKEGNDA